MQLRPLKSHLFWFVLLGASIFAIDALRRNAIDEIVVDEGIVQRIAALWQVQMQRAPDARELDGLIRDWVDEEIMYREAKRLDLDTDDVIVRRRLIQKIEFIAEESAAEEPSDEALRGYFDAHAERYRSPARYSFDQVFFRDERDADRKLEALRSTADWRAVGEPGMANPSYGLRSEEEIVTALGTSFFESLAEFSPAADWQGPIRSEFGWHWVRLSDMRLPAPGDFSAVRDRMLNDYLFDARAAAKREYLDGLRDRYEVVWKLPESP